MKTSFAIAGDLNIHFSKLSRSLEEIKNQHNAWAETEVPLPDDVPLQVRTLTDQLERCRDEAVILSRELCRNFPVQDDDLPY